MGGLVGSRRRLALQFTAEAAFLAVLRLRFCNGLPLHVAGVIGSRGAERLDVVYDVARAATAALAGRRAGVVPLEGEHLGGVALDSSGVHRPGGCHQERADQNEPTGAHLLD